MKLTTQKTDLVDTLSIVSRAVSTRSSLQVLSGVLLQVDGEQVRLSATNMEISIEAPLSAEVERAGSVVLPARIFSDIAKNLPPGKVTIEQEHGSSQVELRSGESDFVLQSLSADDFPKLPVFAKEEGFSVDREAFLEVIRRVASSASRDETRPVLTGVLVHFQKDAVKMVATDSYRLSVHDTDVESTAKEPTQAIVPARTLLELERIGSSRDAQMIDVVSGSNQVLFRIGEISVISRLIDGQFPNYQQLLPESFDYVVAVDREELLDVIHRIGLLAQKNAPIRLNFSENTLTVKAQTQDVGRARESIPVQFDGDELEIGFNPEFLEAGVASVRGETVYLKFISPLRPGLITGADDGFVYLIMPIRLTET